MPPRPSGNNNSEVGLIAPPPGPHAKTDTAETNLHVKPANGTNGH